MSPPPTLIPACSKGTKKSEPHNGNRFIFRKDNWICMNHSFKVLVHVLVYHYRDWLSIISDQQSYSFKQHILKNKSSLLQGTWVND